ncbi:hypothetical protein ACLBWZ_06575 [Brucellaceae bacterium C25G]
MSDQSKSSGKKGRKALLLTTAAIIVVVGGGLTGYKYIAQKNISEQITKQGGSAESVTADLFGNIHLKNVTIPMKDGRNIKIETFDGRPQFLFLTGQAKATGISTENSLFKINIPQIEIDDANFNKQVLTELFSGSSELSPAQRVERFSAKRIHVSEIQLEQTVLDTQQKTVYKNLTLNDIKDGKIASIQLDNAQVDMNVAVPKKDGSVEKEPLSVLMGMTEGKDIDAAFMVRFYTEKADPDNKEPQQVQGAYSTKDITIKLPQASVTVDEIKSASISMRLPDYPFWDLMKEIGAVEDIDAMGDEERRDLFRKLITIYEIFGKGDAEIVGIKITPEDKTKASGTISNVSMTFNNQTFDMSLKGMNIGTGTDYVKIDDFSWKGFDYAASLEGVKKLLDVPTDEINSFPFTTLMPTFGTFSFSGIDVDLPNTDKDDVDFDETEDTEDTIIVPGQGEDQDDADVLTEESEEETIDQSAPARVKFKVKGATIALLNPVNGIPTDIQINYDSVDFPIPAEDDEMSAKLRELGLDRVVLTSNTHLVWDEPSETLIVKDISYQEDKLGSVSLSGVINNMSREFFSGDKTMMQVAALGLRPKEINLRVVDKGLVNSVIKFIALEDEITEEETRQMAVMTIGLLAAQFADRNPQVTEVVAALNKFIANPNIFTLSVKSKNEKGIGAFEMLAATQNPLSLLDKVDISATAE